MAQSVTVHLIHPVTYIPVSYWWLQRGLKTEFGCWHGVRCRFAYGPADTTAILTLQQQLYISVDKLNSVWCLQLTIICHRQIVWHWRHGRVGA